MTGTRAGIGVDAHAFDPARVLVLGGVTIEGARGLAGWSDADVLCHAISDALLGAAGLGDMGTYFPKETVARGASSLDILARTAGMVRDAGFSVANVDCVVVIQEVVVSPYRDQIRAKLAGALGVGEAAVNVKATTTDHLGFAGRGEGVAVLAIASLEPGSGE